MTRVIARFLGVTTLVPSGSSSADPDAMEFPVLYTTQVNNVDDIVLITPTGEHRKVTDHRRKDSSPSLSLDGRYIVFASERVGWWKIWKIE